MKSDHCPFCGEKLVMSKAISAFAGESWVAGHAKKINGSQCIIDGVRLSPNQEEAKIMLTTRAMHPAEIILRGLVEWLDKCGYDFEGRASDTDWIPLKPIIEKAKEVLKDG